MSIGTVSVIQRAIFVLTGPEAGQQFLRVIPDLRGIGLSEATLLHMLSAQPGPAEPMPELANWVRHFEAAVPAVELALKRGDPVKWIFELARVRSVDLVVICSEPDGSDWDLERVSSPLRSLGIPVLLLPDAQLHCSLGERVLVAVKAPGSLEAAMSGLGKWFPAERLHAVRVVKHLRAAERRVRGRARLDVVEEEVDVATTLLQMAEQRDATLLAVLAGEEAKANAGLAGVPVVQPLIEATHLPILIWPIRSRSGATG